MKNSRIKQALHYQLNYFGWSSLWVYGISVTVLIALSGIIILSVNDANMNAGISSVAFVHLLILGIGIRGDLKFYLQHGISRRTTFISTLFNSMLCAVLLGVFCEVIYLILNRWINPSEILYAYGVNSFFINWLRNTILFVFAWQIGTLISLIYYRLGGVQKVIFSVLAIGALILAFSGVIHFIVSFTDNFTDLVTKLTDGSYDVLSPVLLITLALAIIAAGINYFLLRRAPVKE